MRTLRLSLAGTVILALLGGLGGAVVAQDEAEEPTGVRVTVTQECADVGHPAVTGPPVTRASRTHSLPTLHRVRRSRGCGGPRRGLRLDGQSFEGPEGGWTGHVYALWGEPTQNFLVLSGTGANEGWQYIASGTDPDTDGDFEWIGTLYEGELPPFPETAVAAERCRGARGGGRCRDDRRTGRLRGPHHRRRGARRAHGRSDHRLAGRGHRRRCACSCPAGFDPEADADWPVLYLLHGRE